MLDMEITTTGIVATIFFAISIHLLNKLLRKNIDVKGAVLITGCDSGFGYSSALELSRRNIFVFAGCLNQLGVERLENDPNFTGRPFLMDITKQDDIANAKQIIQSEGRDLWAIVNNAGIFEVGPIEWQSVERMQNTMNVNLWGAVNVTKTLLPLLKANGGGRLVNVTSMAGRVLLLNGTAYSMSKFALEAFSDGLRYELQPWGVSVHVIEPGMFATNILGMQKLKDDWRSIWERQPISVQEEYGEKYYRKAVDVTEGLVTKLASCDIGKVVGAVCDAVTSSRPRLRYAVGVDANTLWMVIATMPTWVGDLITKVLAQPATPSAMK